MLYIYFQNSIYTYTSIILLYRTYTKGQRSCISFNLTHINYKNSMALYDNLPILITNVCNWIKYVSNLRKIVLPMTNSNF